MFSPPETKLRKGNVFYTCFSVILFTGGCLADTSQAHSSLCKQPADRHPPGQTPHLGKHPPGLPLKRAVHILLEWILVLNRISVSTLCTFLNFVILLIYILLLIPQALWITRWVNKTTWNWWEQPESDVINAKLFKFLIMLWDKSDERNIVSIKFLLAFL